MNEHAKVSVTLEPADENHSRCRIELQGEKAKMLMAYEELSVAFFTELANSIDDEFCDFAYAMMQNKIIERVPALKKSFDETVEQSKKVDALMSILGKTFTMPEKEDAE